MWSICLQDFISIYLLTNLWFITQIRYLLILIFVDLCCTNIGHGIAIAVFQKGTSFQRWLTVHLICFCLQLVLFSLNVLNFCLGRIVNQCYNIILTGRCYNLGLNLFIWMISYTIATFFMMIVSRSPTSFEVMRLQTHPCITTRGCASRSPLADYLSVFTLIHSSIFSRLSFLLAIVIIFDTCIGVMPRINWKFLRRWVQCIEFFAGRFYKTNGVIVALQLPCAAHVNVWYMVNLTGVVNTVRRFRSDHWLDELLRVFCWLSVSDELVTSFHLFILIK